MKSIIFYFILSCLLFSSCRELVQDEFPEFENAVTVNTIIAAGDSVKVYLAYTDELNENPLETIENAEITMSNQNWDNINFTHHANGMFISDYIAQANDSLHLTVSVPGEDVVTSSCVVPQPIEIQYADVAPFGCVNDEGAASPLVYVKIRNDSDLAFYGVIYMRTYSKEPRYSVDLNNPEDSYSVDTVYVMEEDYRAIAIIENINESGEFLEKEIEANRVFYSNLMISTAFQLKLRTVDYNYYTYLNSIGAYEVGRNPDFTNSYIAPFNFYSNIENGYGIMGAFAEFETDTIF